MSLEENADDWREIRGRADSAANAVFLLAGGALSLSITVLLGTNGALSLPHYLIERAVWAWSLLLSATLLFLLLKGHLVWQAYMLQVNAEFVNRHLRAINRAGWGIAVLGFCSFAIGMVLLVSTAGAVLSEQAGRDNSVKPTPLRGAA